MEQQISLASFQIYQFMSLVRQKVTNVYYCRFFIKEILNCKFCTKENEIYTLVYVIYLCLYLPNFVEAFTGGIFTVTCRL